MKMKNGKTRLMKLVLPAVCFFVIAALAVGSLLFIGRPKNGGGNGGTTPIVDPDDPDGKDDPDRPEREKREPTITEDDARAEVKKDAKKSVVGILDTKQIPKNGVSIPFAGALSSDGYGTTNLPYDPSYMKIGVMTPNFDVPSEFTLRKKTVTETSVVQNEMYGEFETEETEKEADRPAVELYMGYFIVDDGETLSIYSRAGDFLTHFDDTDYIPAYERDRDGNPLFYRNGYRQSGMFDREGLEIKEYTKKELEELEKDEKNAPKTELDNKNLGKRVKLTREPEDWEKTYFIEGKILEEGEGNPVMEDAKTYYTLSPYGTGFAYSAFNDLTDGRGLRFDYPAYYGISDNGLTLAVKMRDLYTQPKDKPLEMKHDPLWAYTSGGFETTEYDFKRAYNFSEGLGCVVTEPYYKDGGLFFVDGSGRRLFTTKDQYTNNTDRIVITTLMPPVDTGEASIGSFYYDHGLVRVRRESIDGTNYIFDHVIRYLDTEDILIDRSGNEFPIPEGYELVAYSDGVILLKRHGKYGYMDYTGKWIAEPVYSEGKPFSEGLGVLTTADGRCGVIDASGNVVVPFEYSSVSSCSDGVMAAYHPDKGWQILRKMAPV